MDNFYYGDRPAILVHLADSKLLSCVTTLLIFFVALVFLARFLNVHASGLLRKIPDTATFKKRASGPSGQKLVFGCERDFCRTRRRTLAG